MKGVIFILSFFIAAVSFFPALAQEINDGHTAKEETEGKIIWEKLKSKELNCDNLSENNFGSLGEYFMGQMLGTSHEAMNSMMEQMMGKNGEEQMHIVMGKRFSGCDASAAFPSQGIGFMPMMQMMGGWSSPSGFNQTGSEGVASRLYGTGNNMMWNFGVGPMGMGFGFFGWILMIFWWLFIIVLIIALVKWLVRQFSKAPKHEKSAFDIAKERYAKGEINKEEFEEMKRNLI